MGGPGHASRARDDHSLAMKEFPIRARTLRRHAREQVRAWVGDHKSHNVKRYDAGRPAGWSGGVPGLIQTSPGPGCTDLGAHCAQRGRRLNLDPWVKSGSSFTSPCATTARRPPASSWYVFDEPVPWPMLACHGRRRTGCRDTPGRGRAFFRQKGGSKFNRTPHTAKKLQISLRKPIFSVISFSQLFSVRISH